MINELFEERAALYASGMMTPQEREHFELVLEFHHELRDFVHGLAEVGTALTLAAVRSGGNRPSPELKNRIMGKLLDRPQQTTPDGLVMCGPDGLVQWINPAFGAMCGYTLEELRGKKLGPILQGERTDRATVERMRRAVHECRPCRENVLNYHKSGNTYWVEIAITPILDDKGKPLWLVARERELPDGVAA
jgi:PAS domain S-box-containing protein